MEGSFKKLADLLDGSEDRSPCPNKTNEGRVMKKITINISELTIRDLVKLTDALGIEIRLELKERKKAKQKKVK